MSGCMQFIAEQRQQLFNNCVKIQFFSKNTSQLGENKNQHVDSPDTQCHFH